MPPPYLPDELLLLILHHLKISYERHGDATQGREPIQHTLYNVCLASKRLHSLCQQDLYETVDICRHGSSTLIRLLRTLERRRNLAAHVRELRMAASTFDSQESLADRDWQLMTRGLQAELYFHPLPERLRARIRAGLTLPSSNSKNDAYLAMFFLLCPRLERWDLSVAGWVYKPLTNAVFDAMGAAALPSSPGGSQELPLQSLREICARNRDAEQEGDDNTIFDLLHLRSFLRLPSIKTLKASRATLLHPLIDGTTSSPFALYRILEFCPYLKELKIEQPEWRHPASLLGIGEFLNARGTALRRLTLHANEEWWNGERLKAISFRPVESLQRLEDLTELSIQSIMLTGLHLYRHEDQALAKPLAELLPSALEKLEISCFSGWNDPIPATCFATALDDRVLNLLADKRFRRLRLVKLSAKSFLPLEMMVRPKKLGWEVTTSMESFRTQEGRHCYRSEMRMCVDFRRQARG